MTSKVIKNRKLFYTWLVANYGKGTKQKFIKNLRKQHTSNSFYNRLQNDPSWAVSSAFVWYTTPEGKEFWQMISDELYKRGNIISEDIPHNPIYYQTDRNK